jgi:tetratricopeptide (TPR) repeat protein
MKKNGGALVKLLSSLLVLLIAVCNIQTGMGSEENAASLHFFTVAMASAVSSADLQKQYDAAQALFDAKEYDKAFEAFDALGKFSDSRARAADSKRKWKAASYKEAMALYENEKYDEAKEIFQTLGDYEKSRSYLYTCTMKSLRSKYQQAEEMFAAGDYQGAQTLFESLGKFHDSPKRAQAAADMIKAKEQAEADLNSYEKGLSLKEAGDLEGARDAFIEAGDCKDATDQLYTVISMLDFRATYEKAEGYYNSEDYENAYDLFLALEDYKDSAEKANLSKEAWQASVYEQATTVQNSDPNRAYILFLFLDDYKDSAALADKLQEVTTTQNVYTAADTLAQAGDYAQAKRGFEAISTYSDSQERVAQLSENVQQMQDFKQAMFYKSIGELEKANAIFKSLGDFNKASEMISPVTKKFTTKHLRDDRTSPKSSVFTAADGTKHYYRIYKGVHTWVEAKAFCEVLGGHLATVTTPEENEFVYRFMRSCGYLTAYFGLSDEKRTGNWVWVTGEPYVYKNWRKGQPSRSAHERYGMYFYKHTDGTWNDSHFYELVKVDPGCSYICEWDE